MRVIEHDGIVNYKSLQFTGSNRISAAPAATRLANKVARFAEDVRARWGDTLAYDSLAAGWPAPFERGTLDFTVIDRNGRDERHGLSERGLAALKILYSRPEVASQLPRVFNVRQTESIKTKSNRKQR